MPVSSFLRKRVTTLTASSPSPSAIPAKMTPPKIQARPNRSPSLSEDPTWSNVAVNSNSLSSSSPTPGKLDDVRSFFKRAPGTTQLERVHGLDSATGNSQSALTSSTDTADLVTPPLSLAVPAVEFVLFPKLPAEIQLMIWEEGFVPRVVGMKPAEIPAIAHASHDARNAAEYFFKKSKFRTGIFINPRVDILHFDKSSFTPEIGYHIHGHHTLCCAKIGKVMTKRVERVAFSVAEVDQIMASECFHCFLVIKFARYFPSLKELIIFLRPGPLGSSYENLYEVVPALTLADNEHMQNTMKDIKMCFEHAKICNSSLVKYKDVKLTFMRFEKWIR